MKIGNNKVVDAENDLILVILNKDIKKATKKNNRGCVVAKACNRQENVEALIHLTRVYLRNGGPWTRYVLPGSLRGELIAFDRGGKFIPGTYVLKAPTEASKLGNHRGKSTEKKSGIIRAKPTYVTDIRANLYNVVETTHG